MTSKAFRTPITFVTGAGGRLGDEVVMLLLRRGHPVIAGSRDPSRIARLGKLGADVRRVDFDDTPDELAHAFAGADRLLLISTDELAHPGRRIAQQLKAVTAARVAGVQQIAYTSMPLPDEASPIPFADDHRLTEAAIVESGMTYDILRNGWYFENLLGVLPFVIRSGIWYTAAGEGRIPYIARHDTALAAVESLTGGMRNRVVDLAGPEAMTVDEMAAAIRQAFGVEVRVTQVSSGTLLDHLVSQGVDPRYAPLMVVTDINQRLGRFDVGRDGLRAMTGHVASSFADFLKNNRDTLLIA